MSGRARTPVTLRFFPSNIWTHDALFSALGLVSAASAVSDHNQHNTGTALLLLPLLCCNGIQHRAW